MIKLSVIIPTRDRARLLAKNLDSILGQSYPRDRFEVIVVDNGSKDSTAEVCRNYAGRFVNFKYIYAEEPGLHVGRHLGMKNARADILVYADDDIKAFPTWLEGISESFEDENTVLVGGKCLPDFEAQPPAWFDGLWKINEYGRFMDNYSILDFGDRALDFSPYFVWGCNFSIRRKTLVEAGGFHPDSMPASLIKYRGDGETAIADFIHSKKYRTVYNPNASVCHFVSAGRMSFEYLYRRNFAQGVSISYSEIRGNMGAVPGAFAKTIRWYKIKFKSIARALLGVEKSCEAIEIAERGIRDGYDFHQSAAYKDKTLLDWILKKDYYND